MARSRGRSRRGGRLRAAIPHGHYKTVTLVAGFAPSRPGGGTVAGLLIALDACADIFKPTECANYFTACGYDNG
jgi:hypothetical protein